MATNNINTGNCPKEETEGDAYQITNRKRYDWDLECFRTLNQRRRLEELTYAPDKYGLDIIELSDTHYNKCGETSTEEGHGLWFGSDDGR